jgi:hypothetical protein
MRGPRPAGPMRHSRLRYLGPASSTVASEALPRGVVCRREPLRILLTFVCRFANLSPECKSRAQGLRSCDPHDVPPVKEPRPRVGDESGPFSRHVYSAAFQARGCRCSGAAVFLLGPPRAPLSHALDALFDRVRIAELRCNHGARRLASQAGPRTV